MGWRFHLQQLETLSPPSAGFFMVERLDLRLTAIPTDRVNIMAKTKKPAAKKKPDAKKPGFLPKIKSTKKNGLGTY